MLTFTCIFIHIQIYVYIHLYIYTQFSNYWYLAHTYSIKMLIQIFKPFLKLDLSQLLYICRLYDVYYNVISTITWIRFPKMSCLLLFPILTFPRKVFHCDSSMLAMCCVLYIILLMILY